jgi:hypothetical protein
MGLFPMGEATTRTGSEGCVFCGETEVGQTVQWTWCLGRSGVKSDFEFFSWPESQVGTEQHPSLGRGDSVFNSPSIVAAHNTVYFPSSYTIVINLSNPPFGQLNTANRKGIKKKKKRSQRREKESEGPCILIFPSRCPRNSPEAPLSKWRRKYERKSLWIRHTK